MEIEDQKESRLAKTFWAKKTAHTRPIYKHFRGFFVYKYTIFLIKMFFNGISRIYVFNAQKKVV